MSEYRIERLAKQSRTGFDCGEKALNRYFITQASQETRRRYAVCYVLIENSSDRIVGFYTLSAGSVALPSLPESLARKLPRYPEVPIARIGRLAIDLNYQSRGLGGVLVVDAVKRVSGSEIGVYAIVVDAKSEEAARFYERFGFMQFKDLTDVLYLPISDALRSW
jgi:GNAT superfamily N-acetyltransferase